MNPFEQRPMSINDGIVAWAKLYPKPYDKQAVDPYTKIRIILMNGIEDYEAKKIEEAELELEKSTEGNVDH